MGVYASVNVTVQGDCCTYRLLKGPSDSGSPFAFYTELHVYPRPGAEVEWFFTYDYYCTYNNGSRPVHSRSVTRWNGFTWMEQEASCPLAADFGGSSASYIASIRYEVTIYGRTNAFQYQLHDPNMGRIDWLYQDSAYIWDTSVDYEHETTSMWKTGEVNSKDISFRIVGNSPYVPGSRMGEDLRFYGSTYGVCVSALWEDRSLDPDTVNSYGPSYNYREASIRDGYYNRSTYQYDWNLNHNMVHIYFWRPWIWVSCDYEYNARWDERQDYDPIHYPGATPPACSPEGLLSVYLDLSTYQHLNPGGGLPTPSWPGHELCVNQNYPGATWFDRSSITSTRAKGIYELCNLTSYSDHMLYCAWRNLSCEVDVYAYAPSQSKYIDFRSGDYPAHVPDPATGASIYNYGSYKRLILSGPVGTDGWHYKYEVENGRRQYFYVYGSTRQGEYKYLSSGTDNGTSFQSGPTPYDNEEYFFYTNGGNHTIVFNFKKNGGFTYLPMYYPGSNVLIRGVKTNLPIRDGDG